MFWIRGYTKTMLFWMRWITGVRIIVRGREKVPVGPCIIAAKHQSWGDGFAMFSQFHDLAFVTGDHLEKFPLVGGVLRKMGAIVVDNCGGAFARARLVDDELNKAKALNRRILIYPEGHLSPVGQQHRYKKGVYHMYQSYGCVCRALSLPIWASDGHNKAGALHPATRSSNSSSLSRPDLIKILLWRG